MSALVVNNTSAHINAGNWYRRGRTWEQAIQAAIDFAASKGVPATVVVPPGPEITLSGPIYIKSLVHLDARRQFVVSTGSWPTSAGCFTFTSCSGAALSGPFVRQTAQQAAVVWFGGAASNITVRDLNVNNGRSIWFQDIGGNIYLNNITARNGTAIIGAGASISASIGEIICHGLFGYDLIDEAIDLNFGVKRFICDGFYFRNVAAAGGEAVDIGGGLTEYVKFANGIIDFVGLPRTGFNIKLNSAKVDIHGVQLINSSISANYAFKIDDSDYVNLDGCFVDHTFERGLQVEPGAKNISGNVRCNSPIVFSGGVVNADFHVQMDLVSVATTVIAAAFAVAGSCGHIKLSGRIANYIGYGVSYTTCSSFHMHDLDIINVRRGISSDRGGDKIYMKDITITNASTYGVLVSSTSNFHIDGMEIHGYGGGTSNGAVQLGGITTGRVYNLFVQDGVGHPLIFNSGDNIHYNNIINQSVSTKSVSVGGAVTNITGGVTISWT